MAWNMSAVKVKHASIALKLEVKALFHQFCMDIMAMRKLIYYLNAFSNYAFTVLGH